MDNIQKLQKYVPLVKFIAAACGEDFEVVLHDTSNPKNSIIAIENGYLTGRKIGDSVTNLAAKLDPNEYVKRDFIAAYRGLTESGKTFVSSTFFIKEAERVIGAICINHDVSRFVELHRLTNECLPAFLQEKETEEALREKLDASISSISTSIIDTTISSYTVDPARLNHAEKLEIIGALEAQDVFATKGAVSYVAQALKISRPTVYRNLQKIRESRA